MLKTIIFSFEDVILNDEYLQFKIYEKLWYYMRQDPAWSDFEAVLKLRENYFSERRSTLAYPTIASRYLSETNQIRFEQDVRLFVQKQSLFYLRALPDMLSIVRNLKYYYKIALIAHQKTLYQKASRKYRFDRLFHYISLPEQTLQISQYRQNLQEIVKHLRSTEKETLLISGSVYPDLAAARQAGILTLQTLFDPSTRGFQPQSYLEWKYYHSLKRLHEQKKANRAGGIKVDARASRPSEVSHLISDLERAGSQLPTEETSVQTETETFWELAREIFNIPRPGEEK